MSECTRATRARRGAAAHSDVPTPTTVTYFPRSDRTVDLALAVRVAAMDRRQLEAVCAEWGVLIPARASKARLAELLFTRASEPRPPAAAVAHSPLPAQLDPAASRVSDGGRAQGQVKVVGDGQSASGGGGAGMATSMRSAQDAASLRDAAVCIVALRLADVPAHARPEGELLTMLHASKACLVCQGWKRAFSDPRLRSSLDCTQLTRQGFLYELRRPQSAPVYLRMGSLKDWPCFQRRLLEPVNLSELKCGGGLTSHELKAHQDWRQFAGELFTCLVGSKGLLQNLLTLDLSCLFDDKQAVELSRLKGRLGSLFDVKQLVELSRCCPQLQHLCLPLKGKSTLASITAGPGANPTPPPWPAAFHVLLLWKDLRSYSLDRQGNWKAPAQTPTRQDEKGSVTTTCSLETLESLTGYSDDERLCETETERAARCAAATRNVPRLSDYPWPLLTQWLQRGAVFKNLRRLQVLAKDSKANGRTLEITEERFPVLEDLSVRISQSTVNNVRIRARVPALRKLFCEVPGKNSGGFRALSAPQLELLIYKGGNMPHWNYAPVCCQISRALTESTSDFLSLKAFLFDGGCMSEHHEHVEYMPHSGVECRGTVQRAIAKLLNSPCLQAAGIFAGYRQWNAGDITAVDQALVLPLHLKACSVQFSPASAEGLPRVPIDTCVASSLRWLKISLKRDPYQLCQAIASNCPLLEHVYISGSERVYIPGSDADSNVLAVLGRNLAHLQVICVSHASKADVQACLTGASAVLLRYVGVDTFALKSLKFRVIMSALPGCGGQVGCPWGRW